MVTAAGGAVDEVDLFRLGFFIVSSILKRENNAHTFIEGEQMELDVLWSDGAQTSSDPLVC